MKQPALPTAHTRAHWWHLLLLLGLVSILQWGRWAFASEMPFFFSIFVRSLYGWVPAIAGIAISVSQSDHLVRRKGIEIGLAAAVLMVVLDIWSSFLASAVQPSAALFPNASIGLTNASQAASLSWVRVLIEGVRGDLSGFRELVLTYDVGNTRLRVAQAVTQASQLLAVYASIGFVIAASSWTRAHVVFRKPQDASAFQVVIAWLVAPLVVEITNRLSADQRFRVLFKGVALWRPAVPHLVVLLAGLAAWWYTARYRESEDA